MLQPDRVAMQDATAQMALLQFMLAEKKKALVPSSVHCDHLIMAYRGVDADMKEAWVTNKEVFEFLASASSHYGIDFWKPNAGIIHQVILENYAFPGALMIGTDSHTPNAGGLGMAAIGVGGADAADVMAGLPWELKCPRLIGVHLKGKISGWTSAKDVIIKLCGLLTVKGGTDCIIEYFGEGTSSISCTGKATITNMGAELGATCSIFPYDTRMESYLERTGRKALIPVIEKNKELLVADKQVLENPQKYYDQIVEIDLSTLEPYITGPHSPDKARPLSQFQEERKKENWPSKITNALIGSCTNSSYEDIGRVCSVLKQAQAQGLKMKQPFWISPGSSQIRKTIEKSGYMAVMESVGAVVLANACGPCIGQWQRDDFKKGEENVIVSSFNRNFRGRNDANPSTLSFITSPEIVAALGLSGQIDFNPLTDSLTGANGKEFFLKPPSASELPEKFIYDPDACSFPKGSSVKVTMRPDSNRLERLTAFKPWDGEDIKDALVLCKAKGKCTTDHISPAGKWLRFRGHLNNISDNLLSGAVNSFYEDLVGKGKNLLTGKVEAFSEVARSYVKQKTSWIIIGDENYGEGSSREHAAMSPRFLGGVAVIAKSFARIHETNLKKQGMLALCFVNPADYDRVLEDDKVTIEGLKGMTPCSRPVLVLKHSSGQEDRIELSHSFNKEQIKWFQAGSALNLIRG